jgi:GNAT superfamily N-acetyltransferase
MPDLLVKLYELREDESFWIEQGRQDVLIRKPLGSEKLLLTEWVRKDFGNGWASEIDVALCNHPISCFIAIKNEAPIGFACYDAGTLGFFGPIGVDEGCRNRGTGKALLLACLFDMRLKGYGYAVIGWAAPVEFYQKTVEAVEIPGDQSTPGVYRTMLRYPKK